LGEKLTAEHTVEAGNAVLRLICMKMDAEAWRRRERDRAIKWLHEIPGRLEPQIFRGRIAGWTDRNDRRDQRLIIDA
jgi:hypothetical protein